MNQQGAARGHEDDWWRQLYGDGSEGERAGGDAPARGAVCDAGPSDAPDTLDDRVESALRALGAPRWADPAPEEPPDPGPAAQEPWSPPARPVPAPPARHAPPPPEPSAPIPLRSTGPGTRATSTDRAPADRPSTDHPSGVRPSPDRRATDRQATPAPRTPRATPPPATTGLPGDRPPSYGEPGELPAADAAALDDLVPDTTLDGGRYGTLTLRAVSHRGDAARRRGDVRRDALLTARFGAGRHALLLVAVATGRPAAEGAHRAARDACTWIGGAVGRSYTRLAEDIRTDRRGALRSGLQRLTDRSHGKLRGRAPERGAAPQQYPAALRCLLLPADPDCRTRVFFGVGAGGLFLLRDGAWQDLEPATDHVSAEAGRDDTAGLPCPASGPPHGAYPAESPARPEPFLFRTAFARPGDTLLLCSSGLAEPLREEPAFAARLADRWSAAEPPGLVDVLAAAQLRVEGHPKDRTAVGVWES
ncbi:protein phosphatase 2C domain-containing protein [Streptomyces sp. NRRL S-1813]|uniref:protein phosphatase 2C domain-containing protein n=1 Tax=Streptomyces sp. NRRL S-1813 TaxID=1463888 RepID=UPI0004CACDE0|nr:protein phosphatase 2C domain-containing protein [Streptomyces sp. NRRL S-1813]